jgi:class 3 adenylate cyclase/predicted ATPase
MDLTRWLAGLGLEQYQHAFREGDVDAAVLPELTADDLTALGVTSIGHRRKLLAAIADLRPALRTALDLEAAGGTTVSPARTPVADAERRQVTVMFCDLVGSTALSLQLDPEDLWQVIGAYHSCVAQTVGRYDGFVAKYMGDGVLVYFGYPQSHEDDAERAVRAGLALVDAVAAMATADGKLSVRIGIGTGIVVIGDLIGEERAVVGETPNLAARLQALSEPNTVVIGPRTRRLLGDLFEYRDVGSVELKGFAERLQAYQVLRPSATASRFEALHVSALSRLVGRGQEIDLLLRRWARAKARKGQGVLVSGEAGIGKSRIIEALQERLHAEPHLRLRYFCSPYHEGSALFPFIDQLGRAAGFGRDDPPTTKLNKLETVLVCAGTPGEDVAFLADLLSLPGSERHPLPDLSPRRKKERTLEALIRLLEGLARQQPVLMVFEDAHWSDPTSRELLDLTVERLRSLPVLLIVTSRPEFQPTWASQPQVTMLTLDRLDRPDRTALVTQIAGRKALPDEVIDQIADRTDGVPLFIEELTKSVLESGLLREEADRYVLERALQPFAIPTSLHASLLARLDRLASVRHVAQIGAAIGREFSYALLHTVSHLSHDELQAALARLVASELVFQRGSPPAAVYSFKHALVQDAAHGSLLHSARQQLHAQIAHALETQSPQLIESQPELFAQHYAQAGMVEKSVIFWGKAGRRSAARSAVAEAAAQFQKALDQLAILPDNRERQRHELELRSSLGATLLVVKGFGAPEAGHAYARARELWEQMGSPLEFRLVPYGQSRYYAARGELDLALRLDKALLRLSRHHNDSVGLVLSHYSSGRNLLLAGRFASSRWHLEAALALYDPISHHSLAHQAGFSLEVVSQGILGIVLFCLGFPDQALAQRNAAIAAARRLAHPPSLGSTLSDGTVVLALVGDSAALNEWADELLALASDQGFPYFRALGTIGLGWARIMNGDVTAGISLLRNGSTAYRASGAEAYTPHHLVLLARACEIAGQIEESLTLLNDASQIVERTGVRWLASELSRHKGRLLQKQGRAEAAEELYRKALSIAQKQQAKLWELRAAVSLARLWDEQGRRAAARDLLSPAYSWFTEGFDTPDLKEAKALLDELSA